MRSRCEKQHPIQPIGVSFKKKVLEGQLPRAWKKALSTGMQAGYATALQAQAGETIVVVVDRQVQKTEAQPKAVARLWVRSEC